MISKIFIAVAFLYGFAGVFARSLSSHAIKPQLEAREKLESFNIAASFMLYHALALLLLAVLVHLFPKAGFQWTGWAFVLGSLLFQGSVFVKSFVDIGSLGMLTPLGGAVLMIGWLLGIVWAWRMVV